MLKKIQHIWKSLVKSIDGSMIGLEQHEEVPVREESTRV